jgi:Fe-S oxidoreductase
MLLTSDSCVPYRKEERQMFLSEEERAETIRACRYCPMCNVADRVAQLVRRESYTPRGRGAIISAIDQGLLDWDKAAADIMYTTLNDGLLQEWCVGNYDHEELVLDTRARIHQRGLMPEEAVKFIEGLRSGQVAGRNPEEILSKEGIITEPSAEVLLFCGCVTLESQATILLDMGNLFNHAGMGFQVLPEEPCCGWPLYQLGDLEGAKEFSVRVAGRIRASGASTVVVLDADCYRMLLTRNGRFGGDLRGIKVIHATALLADWVESGRIKAQKKISDPVTYHDPCALARYCEDADSPRKILASILDSNLTEMDRNRRLANCCGAGGMLDVTNPGLADEVALLRLEEARETGASIVATGCPRCNRAFTRAMNSEGRDGLQVMHLARMLAIAAGLVSEQKPSLITSPNSEYA